MKYMDEIQKYFELNEKISQREAFYKNGCKEPAAPKQSNTKTKNSQKNQQLKNQDSISNQKGH